MPNKQSNRSDFDLLKRLLSYMKGEERLIGLTIACLFIYAGVSAYTPTILARAFDKNIAESDTKGLLMSMVLLLILYIVSLITFRQQLIWLGTLGQKVLLKLRLNLFQNLQKLPLSYFYNNEPGDLMSRLVNDTNSVGTLFSQSITQTLGSVISLIFIIVAMFAMDWRMALITGSVIPFMVFLSIYFSRKSRKAFAKSRESLGELSSDLEENLRMVRESQAFVRQAVNISHFEVQNAYNRDRSLDAVRITAIFSPTIDVLSTLAQIAVIGIGGYLAFNGLTSVGVIVAFLAYSQKFYRPIQMLASFYNQLQDTLASSERIFSIMDEPKEQFSSTNKLKLGQVRGKVTFNHVDFGYTENKLILKDLNFEVAPGKLVALIGETGVGKSTTLNLIPRYYQVNKGAILIDDVNINDIELSSLRSTIAEVPQSSYLFSDTIAANISFGDEDPDQKRIIEAAKQAQIHDLIMSLPKQYDQFYGAKGVSFSQGQQQLLCIARALYADPAIILLDEATSNIDTGTEKLVQEAMAKALKGRTAFVIAHRLNTIEKADEIFVLEGGKVKERGTHSELLNLENGYYKALLEKQSIL